MANKRSESFDAASFFDRNAAVYAREVYVKNGVRPFANDPAFFEFIKKNPSGKTLLDVGAGSGRFSSLVRLNFPNIQVTALDPSINLLTMIQDRSIRKVVGKIPDLNLDPGERFSFIHVSNVLHHLVGKTINESRNIVKESLLALRDHLEDSGFLMIMEEVWETYAIPSASRTLAFLLLSLANQLNVAVPWFFSPCNSQNVKGLIVCMYPASDLENILKDSGFEVVEFQLYPYQTSTARRKLFKKIIFLKQWGQMQFVVRKADPTLKP